MLKGVNVNDPTIGLICKSHNYTNNNGNVATGDWVISKNRIGDLVGQTVILTEGSQEPAYKGGEITGYNLLPSGKYMIFFQSDYRYNGWGKHIGQWVKGENPVRYL